MRIFTFFQRFWLTDWHIWYEKCGICNVFNCHINFITVGKSGTVIDNIDLEIPKQEKIVFSSSSLHGRHGICGWHKKKWISTEFSRIVFTPTFAWQSQNIGMASLLKPTTKILKNKYKVIGNKKNWKYQNKTYLASFQSFTFESINYSPNWTSHFSCSHRKTHPT